MGLSLTHTLPNGNILGYVRIKNVDISTGGMLVRIEGYESYEDRLEGGAPKPVLGKHILLDYDPDELYPEGVNLHSYIYDKMKLGEFQGSNIDFSQAEDVLEPADDGYDGY